MAIISLYKSGKCNQIINDFIQKLLFYTLSQLNSELEVLILSTPIVAFHFVVLVDALKDFLLLIWVTESLVELSYHHEGWLTDIINDLVEVQLEVFLAVFLLIPWALRFEPVVPWQDNSIDPCLFQYFRHAVGKQEVMDFD